MLRLSLVVWVCFITNHLCRGQAEHKHYGARLALERLLEYTKQDGVSFEELRRAIQEELEAVNEPSFNPRYHIDDRVQMIFDASQDEDCRSREFDVLDEDFDETELFRVFDKCKVVIVRNVYSTDFTQRYQARFMNFLSALNTGKINQNSKTTHGDETFVANNSKGRYDILFPRDLADENLYRNPVILNLINEILGGEYFSRVMSMGALLSNAQASAGHWHSDEDPLFGHYSFSSKGIAGHDIPSIAVQLVTPMINTTLGHGPTEFCLGSTHLAGMNEEDFNFFDDSLEEEFYEYWELLDSGLCHPSYWRTAALNIGDVAIFDYHLKHRGGPNRSPELRPLVYLTYSRYWFRDSNYDDYSNGLRSSDHDDKMIRKTRFGLVKEEWDTVEAGQECSNLVEFKPVHSREYDEEEADPETPEEIAVGNKDLGPAQIFLDGKLWDNLDSGETTILEVTGDSRLDVYDSQGNSIRSLAIDAFSQHILLHQSMPV